MRIRPLVLLLIGCGPDAGVVDTAACGGGPCLTLVSPTDGEIVCGDPLEVVADVENFTLTNETIEDPPPDTGHMHVFLNGQEVSQSEEEIVNVTGVAEGEWQLSLDLAAADHTSLDPYVGLVIYITVDNSLCTE